MCEVVAKFLEEYADFSKELVKQIMHLKNQAGSDESPRLFGQVVPEWERQKEALQQEKEGLCAACEAAVSAQAERPPKCSAGARQGQA